MAHKKSKKGGSQRPTGPRNIPKRPDLGQIFSPKSSIPSNMPYQDVMNSVSQTSFIKELMKDKPIPIRRQAGTGLFDEVIKPIKFLDHFGKDTFDYANKHNVNKRGTLPNFNEFLINLGQNTAHAGTAIPKALKSSGLVKGSGSRRYKNIEV